MLGYNGGLIGANRTITPDESLPGVWTPEEQIKAERNGLWPRAELGQYVVVRSGANIALYPFDAATGFGAKAADPTTLPAGGTTVDIHPTGKAVVIGDGSPSYVSAYKIQRGALGERYADPSTLPSGTINEAVRFSGTGNAVALGTNTNLLQAYEFSLASGFGAKYANVTVSGTGLSRIKSLSFSPDNAYLLIGVQGGTTNIARFRIFEWSESTGFGTQTGAAVNSNSGLGTGYSTAWSPSGNDVALGYGLTPYIYSFPVTAGAFGTAYSNPATLPADAVYDVTFTNNGNYILAAVNTTTAGVNLVAYPFTSGTGFGARSTPSTPPTTGRAYSVAVDKNDSFVLVGIQNTPFLEAWSWSAGFGSKYSNPATLPPNAVTDIAIYTP